MNAILRIKYTSILLPMDVATQVMKLLNKGEEFERDFDTPGVAYTLKGPLEMELTTLPKGVKFRDDSGLPMHPPKASPKPKKARPLGLPSPDRILRLE